MSIRALVGGGGDSEGCCRCCRVERRRSPWLWCWTQNVLMNLLWSSQSHGAARAGVQGGGALCPLGASVVVVGGARGHGAGSLGAGCLLTGWGGRGAVMY